MGAGSRRKPGAGFLRLRVAGEGSGKQGLTPQREPLESPPVSRRVLRSRWPTLRAAKLLPPGMESPPDCRKQGATWGLLGYCQRRGARLSKGGESGGPFLWKAACQKNLPRAELSSLPCDSRSSVYFGSVL